MLDGSVESFVAGDDCPVEINQLFPVAYAELKRLALYQMAPERDDHTLTPTALLHEAYLRLTGDGNQPFTAMSRVHFFAAAAEAMRRVLVEHARKHNRRQQMLQHDVSPARGSLKTVPEESANLVQLDVALTRLSQLFPEKAEVVKLRYFAGLTLVEVAEVLGTSLSTANRHWAYARAWLTRELIEQTEE